MRNNNVEKFSQGYNTKKDGAFKLDDRNELISDLSEKGLIYSAEKKNGAQTAYTKVEVQNKDENDENENDKKKEKVRFLSNYELAMIDAKSDLIEGGAEEYAAEREYHQKYGAIYAEISSKYETKIAEILEGEKNNRQARENIWQKKHDKIIAEKDELIDTQNESIQNLLKENAELKRNLQSSKSDSADPFDTFSKYTVKPEQKDELDEDIFDSFSKYTVKPEQKDKPTGDIFDAFSKYTIKPDTKNEPAEDKNKFSKFIDGVKDKFNEKSFSVFNYLNTIPSNISDKFKEIKEKRKKSKEENLDKKDPMSEKKIRNYALGTVATGLLIITMAYGNDIIDYTKDLINSEKIEQKATKAETSETTDEIKEQLKTMEEAKTKNNNSTKLTSNNSEKNTSDSKDTEAKQFSESAKTIESGEGLFQTMLEMGIPQDAWENILEELESNTQNYEGIFNDLYKMEDGSLGISKVGKLSNDSLLNNIWKAYETITSNQI